ncbi:hypothetical protein [Streptomyces ipomoeae]|uniref:hypothetical protein n=1 Tax=Streptomyces ipomoeae TaxID=103232 RepID=UPI001C683F6E|nr:hypothetical protein [Streptomyces ipomoeae]MDX2937095.1 hypothetical protein [Streptomyces ipomoeae]
MAYLEIPLPAVKARRIEAVGVHQRYRQPFLDTVRAASKELLVRDEDVQALHGF